MLVRSVFALGVVVGAGVLASGLGAAPNGLQVVTQFQPPRPGQIELIAVVFKAHFTGSKAPLDPQTGVTLPGAGPPKTYGLLSGMRLARVQGDVATYVWLSLALKPLQAKVSADQPLATEVRSVTAISSGVTSAHTPSGRLTITSSNQSELAKFGALLLKDGVTNVSATGLNIHAWDDWRISSKWRLGTGFQYQAWNTAWGVVGRTRVSVPAAVTGVETILHLPFSGGLPPPGITGTWTPGSLNVGFQVMPHEPLDFLRLFAPRRVKIQKGTVNQAGWVCKAVEKAVVLDCTASVLTKPITLEGFITYSGSASFNSLSGQGSNNGGVTFGPRVTFTKPPPPTQPSLTLSCPSSVPLNSSIGISGTLLPAVSGEVIKIIYTSPEQTIDHSAATDATGKWKDSIGTNVSGTWNIDASYGNLSATCTVPVA